MTTQNQSIWQKPLPSNLLGAISATARSGDLPNFLRDVLTEKEITEISARFEAAQLLCSGASYETITSQTKLSTRTIARISQWLQNGTGGYDAAIAAISEETHHSHTPPARAE